MISTRNLNELPNICEFRRRTKALAMLDAILSPDWEYRYYSYNSKWSSGEEMASMRNGSGDHWFALLTSDGVAIHGLAHEYPMYRPNAPWPGIFDSLPAEFRENFFNEPAFDTANSTFCIWRRILDQDWSCGITEFPLGDDPDGSLWLLSQLDGDPRRYVRFAADYYETDVPLDAVTAIYMHQPITSDLLKLLNSSIDLSALVHDIAEIGYPEGT